MNKFLLALQFLTSIPVKVRNFQQKDLAQSIIYFPVVGLVLGLGLAGIFYLLSFLNLESWVTNTVLIIILTILTGGLHLDGLADTADALFSRKNKTEMLEIMRDSRIGTMGVLALISVILLKIALLSSLSASSVAPALICACVLSRWSMALLMFKFPYARQEGKAKFFIQGMNLRIFILATLIALCCLILILKLKGVLLILIAGICAYAMGKFTDRKINGITGDTIGATNELIEVTVLFALCILERANLWII